MGRSWQGVPEDHQQAVILAEALGSTAVVRVRNRKYPVVIVVVPLGERYECVRKRFRGLGYEEQGDAFVWNPAHLAAAAIGDA